MSDNRLVLTNYKHGVLSFLMQNNRMESVSFCKEHKEGDIGNIYVAKVINIVPNINAAFIYYQRLSSNQPALHTNYVESYV